MVHFPLRVVVAALLAYNLFTGFPGNNWIDRLEGKCNRPFSHCLCACVYRSRGALFLDNRRDFTEMGQTDFKPLILSM